MITFTKIKQYDEETLQLWMECKFAFRKFSDLPPEQHLQKFIDKSVSFFKVFDNGSFNGCMMIYKILEDSKEIELAGFAKRHVETRGPFKFFVEKIKKKYPDYKIYVVSSELSAGMLFRAVGFRRGATKGNDTFYFYD